MVALVDEFRHDPGDDPLWNESWYFDVVAPDGSWGLYARLALYPDAAWWWAVIVREGEQMLLVRDQTLDLPRLRLMSMEVRGSGLWADVHCHEAMQRWQVNFEGIAVGLDDPTEAYRSERGDRVPVEFELEWEAAADPIAIDGGYSQAGAVTGEVEILGSEALVLDEPAHGRRIHRWGVTDWSTTGDDDTGRPLLEGGLLVDLPSGRQLPLHRAVAAFYDDNGHTNYAWSEWLAHS